MKTLRVCPDNLRHVKQESLVLRECESVKETLRVSDDDVRAAGGAAGVTVRYGGGNGGVVTECFQ